MRVIKALIDRYSLRFLCMVMCGGLYALPSFSIDDGHDIASLHAWGPYSKRYVGISHIPDMKKGLRFDFSVMPGYYRCSQMVPHVLFESGYYPWQVNPDVTRITYRYELEWKDSVYVDVTYHLLDEHNTLVESRCVNRTHAPQNLVLNQMAYIDYPGDYPQVVASGTADARWHDASDYIENETVNKSPQYNLVYDGWRRNEERTSQALDGSVIGKGFGRRKGDRLAYKVNVLPGQEEGIIYLRFRVNKGEKAALRFKGLANTVTELKGTGEYAFVPVAYQCNKAGNYRLELVSESETGMSLDGFFIGKKEELEKLKTVSRPLSFTPDITIGKERKDFMLKYRDIDSYYGVAWNYPMSEIREVLNSELESFFRRKVHDHVSSRLIGDRKGHYMNAFLRPVVLKPHSEESVYMLVCSGDKEQVHRQLAAFHSAPESFVTQTRQDNETNPPLLPGGEKYAFGNRLMQAALLSNVVYPVYTQGEYIRHFTPGKNWNSLYTWDSGFIALGLIDIDPAKAFECIKAYTTPVGSESAFIHHGTPLPIQLYAAFDLWNRGISSEELHFLYPRLKQFFDFMVGKNPYATTRMKGSGLLATWDYFYNSGGWDDYPPQHALRGNTSLRKRVAPVVTSAYYIRAAKILRMMAGELKQKKDVAEYDKVVEQLTHALQTYAWDEASGYYGYVVHDADGNAKKLYRYKDGSNYDKGLDGATPLVAGICTPHQTSLLLNHLFSPKELWTHVGLSTVDRSAPYYREDGYWNGAVWFPHQWMFWKALLDMGEGEKAYQVARTALNTWERECNESYFTFEHFIISSGRGAGWHQFSGLSSPLLNWFAAYYRPGKVTTGFEIRVEDGRFNEELSEYTATLSFDDSSNPHKRCMIVCLAPGKYQAFFNGKPVDCQSRHAGMLEIVLPATNRGGKLLVRPV